MLKGLLHKWRLRSVAIVFLACVAPLFFWVVGAWLGAAVSVLAAVTILARIAILKYRDVEAVNRVLAVGNHPTASLSFAELGSALDREIPNASFGIGHRPRQGCDIQWFALHGPVDPFRELSESICIDEQAGLIVNDHGDIRATGKRGSRFPVKFMVSVPCRLSDDHGVVWVAARSRRMPFNVRRADRVLRAVAPRLAGVLQQHIVQLEAQAAIKRSEFLLEQTNELVWTLNDQTQWSYANGAVLDTYGVTRDDLLRRSFTDFTSSSDAKRDRQMIRNVLNGMSVRGYETRHRKTDGREVVLRIHATPLKAADDRVVGVAGTAGNITEWVHERIEGEYNSGMFAGILSRMPVIFFRLDAEKRFTDVRGRGLARLGAGDGDWNGWDARWLFRNADARIDAALKGGSDVFEIGGVDDAGPWWFLNHLTFDNWHGSGAIGFGIDITEARLAKEQSDRLAFENRDLAHRLLEVQESERRHLARELHDDMGQSLTAIKTVSVALANMRKPQGAEVRKLGTAITEIAGELYELVHKRMRELRPGLLDSLGLVEALKECIHSSRIEQTGVNCRLNVEGRLDNLGELVEITVFRVVQECLTNIVKHAMASDVTVSLIRRAVDDQPLESDKRCGLTLVVNDDGVGLSDTPHKGMGLQGMQERVRALGGELSIKSRPGEGVTIRVELEVPNLEQYEEIRCESVG